MSSTQWKPNTTVAAIIERDGRFLMVREQTDDGVRLNQPAGHLEEGEALVDAVVREVLEETVYHFRPTHLIGVYEFQHCLDVPWRVVLNECIELAKEFGGTDGHKYVNAVLNGLAPKLRALEVAADKAPGAMPGAPVDEA